MDFLLPENGHVDPDDGDYQSKDLVAEIMVKHEPLLICNYELDVLQAGLNILGFNIHGDYSRDNDLKHNLIGNKNYTGYLVNLGSSSIKKKKGILHWVAIKY